MEHLKTFESFGKKDFDMKDLEVGKSYILDNDQQQIEVEYYGLKKKNPELRNKVKMSFGKLPKYVFKWVDSGNFMVMGKDYIIPRLSVK